MRACDLNLCSDLRRPTQIPALPASRSSPATPSTIPLNRVGCPRPPHLQRSNPHRARCTTACQFPRFPPLEVFVRRPPHYVAPPSWAGIRKPSQTRSFDDLTSMSGLPPRSDPRASSPEVSEVPHQKPTLPRSRLASFSHSRRRNAAITVWREADRQVESPSLIQRSGIYNGLRVAFAAQHHHQVRNQCSAAVNVELDDFLC